MNNKEIKIKAKEIAELWLSEAEQNDEQLIEIFSKLGSSVKEIKEE